MSSSMTNWKYIYFVGIGGIGMSALARWFKANGFNVAGYDKTSTTLVKKLVEEGIEVTLEDEIGSVPGAFKEDPRAHADHLHAGRACAAQANDLFSGPEFSDP
jgi:UDP-N-acetylmuramate--alanine ligase